MEPEKQSAFHNNAVFFIEVEKIKPNPFQPRREFDESKLNELADSVRMYGILQPLVVTRKEVVKDDGGLATEYELIAGERRLRAAKIAGLREVPALIRSAEDDDRTKLELAIIENLQREDLNSIDRALAFKQLVDQFNFSHAEVGKKMGRSREYVSNTLRLLLLPEEMQQALREKKISEGHTRPLLMLIDRPQEQSVLFKEIILRKMTVRDAEKVSRRIAYDKVRKKNNMYNPEIVEIEEEVSGALGTRVHIEQKDKGGRIEIDYFDEESLKNILEVIRINKKREDPLSDLKYPQSNVVGRNSENSENSKKSELQILESTGDIKMDEPTEEQMRRALEEDKIENILDDSEKDETVNSQQENSEDQTGDETVSNESEESENSNETEDDSNENNQADFPEEETVSHDKDEDDEDMYSVGKFNI